MPSVNQLFTTFAVFTDSLEILTYMPACAFCPVDSSCNITGEEPLLSIYCHVRDTGSIPGSGRAPREGNGNTHQYSCLGNPMDKKAWRATVCGVAKNQTRLSNSTTATTSHNILCRHRDKYHLLQFSPNFFPGIR